MSLKGKLVAIVGRSGAGKTTMIKYAIKEMSNLEYLSTFTTRKPRSGDFGYIYISSAEYLNLLKTYNSLDIFKFDGNAYISNIETAKEKLQNGINLIFGAYPDLNLLKEMENKYNTSIISIFIDTPVEKSIKTLSLERSPSEKPRVGIENSLNLESTKYLFDHIFEPKMQIKVDIQNFSNLLKNILYA